jgi:hypothetical protein
MGSRSITNFLTSTADDINAEDDQGVKTHRRYRSGRQTIPCDEQETRIILGCFPSQERNKFDIKNIILLLTTHAQTFRFSIDARSRHDTAENMGAPLP